MSSGAERDQRLVRLAVRAYGLLSERFESFVDGLLMVLDDVKRVGRKKRDLRREIIAQELPPVVLILTFLLLEGKGELTDQERENLKGYLVSVFSLEYKSIYAQQRDPLKEILGRIDWYLDGDKGSIEDLFAYVLAEELELDRDGLSGPLAAHLKKTIMPDISKVVDIAFIYEKQLFNHQGLRPGSGG